MANVKISAMPAAAALTGAELVPLVQGGVNVRSTVTALKAFAIAGLTTGSSILSGNGSGGFSNVTIGTGLSFSAGTLSSTAGTPGGTGSNLQFRSSASAFGGVTNSVASGSQIALGNTTIGGATLTVNMGITPKRTTLIGSSLLANVAMLSVWDDVSQTPTELLIAPSGTSFSGTPLLIQCQGNVSGLDIFTVDKDGNCVANNLAVAAANKTGTGKLVYQTTPTLITPVLGVATGTSIALGGATIGADTLGITGSASISGIINAGGVNVTAATIPVNGMYLSAANSLSWSTSTTIRMTISATGQFTTFPNMNTNLASGNAAGYALTSGAASATSPVFSPIKSATTTGIGAQAAGNWSGIVAGAEIVRCISTGFSVIAGVLTTPGGATFHTTSTAITDGAGVGAGTLTTAPSSGNPTKWLGINDNGTTRYVPSW